MVERIEADALQLVKAALSTCSPDDIAFSQSASALLFTFSWRLHLPAHVKSRMDRNAETHELSIVLCDDEYMTAVNKEWRGLDRPTDVLSFEIPQDEYSAVRPLSCCLFDHIICQMWIKGPL